MACATATTALFLPLLPTSFLYFELRNVFFVLDAAHAVSVSIAFTCLFPWVVRPLFFYRHSHCYRDLLLPMNLCAYQWQIRPC
jgi:hypothetical protein